MWQKKIWRTSKRAGEIERQHSNGKKNGSMERTGRNIRTDKFFKHKTKNEFYSNYIYTNGSSHPKSFEYSSNAGYCFSFSSIAWYYTSKTYSMHFNWLFFYSIYFNSVDFHFCSTNAWSYNGNWRTISGYLNWKFVRKTVHQTIWQARKFRYFKLNCLSWSTNFKIFIFFQKNLTSWVGAD